MNFNERLKAARKHAGLTQDALVKKLGEKPDGKLLMSQANLAKMEKNPRTQGSKFSALIANACGVNPEWLTTGFGEMLSQAVAQEVKAVAAIGHSRPQKVQQESARYNDEQDKLLLYYQGMSQEHKSHLLATAEVWYQMDNPQLLPAAAHSSQPPARPAKKHGT